VGGNTTIRVSANDHDGASSNVFEVRKNNVNALVVAPTGDVLPGQANVYNLGSQSTRWKNVYTSNLETDAILASNIRSIGDIRAQNITANGLLTASNIRVLGDYVIMDTITSNTEQMVITNDGTGPALKVTQTGANSIAEFYDDGNALAFKVANDGLVGIGTATPQAKLHVVGSVKATSSISSDTQFLGQASDSATTPSFSFAANPNTGVFQPATSNLAVTTGGTERMRVLANGNVGIGTTNPLQQFHITGSARIDGNALLGDSASTDTHTIQGSTSMTYSGTSAALTVNQQGTGNLFELQDAGTPQFIVVDGGNVGIGTATPLSKLHVRGDARIDSNIIVSGGDIKSGAAVASKLFSDTTTGTIAIGGALTTGAVTLGATGSTGAVSMFPATGAQAITLGGATTGLITLGSRRSGFCDTSGDCRDINRLRKRIDIRHYRRRILEVQWHDSSVGST
jgi:hypothetical protein